MPAWTRFLPPLRTSCPAIRSAHGRQTLARADRTAGGEVRSDPCALYMAGSAGMLQPLQALQYHPLRPLAEFSYGLREEVE